ncbi:hypothetical protein [Humibacter sp.]|uniref:hypothetical protein n=1 Tax=Humibacter sp. TaxID=1940291 RepID=UPI003F7FB43F
MSDQTTQDTMTAEQRAAWHELQRGDLRAIQRRLIRLGLDVTIPKSTTIRGSTNTDTE